MSDPNNRHSEPMKAQNAILRLSSPMLVCALITPRRDRKSTRLNSSHSQISYAVFCLKKKSDIHISDPSRGQPPFGFVDLCLGVARSYDPRIALLLRAKTLLRHSADPSGKLPHRSGQ